MTSKEHATAKAAAPGSDTTGDDVKVSREDIAAMFAQFIYEATVKLREEQPDTRPSTIVELEPDQPEIAGHTGAPPGPVPLKL